MVRTIKQYEILQQSNSEFGKYLKIASGKNSRNFYAAIDHPQLSCAYDYWLDVNTDVENEVPSLIEVNLFTKFSETKIQARAMEIWPLLLGMAPLNSLIMDELKLISNQILAPIQNIENVASLAANNNDYRFFQSESLRIFWRASVRILNTGDIVGSLEVEEQFFEKTLKYRERFIKYWQNTIH